jgi:tetratricopeptide (TPR) repeat protein
MRYYSFILCGILLIGASSCATLKPIGKCSQPDYNGRVLVEDVRYKKNANAIGLTVGVGLPVVGAIAGSQSGLVMKQTDEGRVPAPVGGAVLGALVGTGFSYLSSVIGGYGTKERVTDIDAWANKLGKDYIVLNKSASSVQLILRDAESNYIVKETQDLRDFAKAFPNSLYADAVFDQGLRVVPRKDLPWMIQTFPTCSSVTKAKERYVKESASFKELDEALDRYPVISNDMELYCSCIHNVSDALKYYNKFPNAKKDASVLYKAFESADNRLDDVEKLYRLFGVGSFCITMKESVRNTLIRNNYANAVYDLAERFTDKNSDYASLISCSAKNGNDNAMCDEGVLLYNAGRKDEAKNFFSKAMENGNFRAMSMYARTLPDGKEKTAYQKRAAEGGEVRAMLDLAVAEMHEKRFSSALDWFNKAFAKDPGWFPLHGYMMAFCEAETRHFAEADSDFEKLAELKKGDIGALRAFYKEVGECFYYNQDDTRAAKWWEKYFNTGSFEDDETAVLLATLYYEVRTGKIVGLSKLKPLLEGPAKRGNLSARFMLAVTYLLRSDYKESAYWYEQVFNLMEPEKTYSLPHSNFETKSSVALTVGSLYRKLGDTKRSNEWREKAKRNSN